MWESILAGLGFAVLLLLLWTDFLISKSKKVIFMSNQMHVLMYLGPMLLSFVLIILSQNTDEPITIYEIILILIFMVFILYIQRSNRIILLNAKHTDVVDLVDKMLKEENIKHSFFSSDSENITAFSVENINKAIVIKDFAKWIEINAFIYNRSELLISMDKYIRKNSSNLKGESNNHNLFFILLNILIIGIGAYLVFFLQTV